MSAYGDDLISVLSTGMKQHPRMEYTVSIQYAWDPQNSLRRRDEDRPGWMIFDSGRMKFVSGGMTFVSGGMTFVSGGMRSSQAG